jgi:amino acid transporter/mannitol/fructose-specific phosphotransferase system IIA component (Ntr-type)
LTPAPGPDDKLAKELGLFDVFAVATGAMVSSGFFLLPGLAAAKSGPSVVLAYGLAGLLVVPALVSKAELSTAMPRAGGTYYFLDRALGPLVGTIGGLGTWASLVFKSAFALLGISAYMALFADVPITPVALVLTAAFVAVNVLGAKETTGLQNALVIGLLTVVGFFVLQGLVEVFAVEGAGTVWREKFTPFFAFGADGLIATVGFVFVSYTGLTKVASVAEEVKDPDRNIPRGMFLSLAVATVIYVVGVAVMVAVLDAETFRSDLTPAATAAEVFFDWLPGEVGLLLVVVAAFAAFASTANAGLLSASRYPLAMARDDLLPGALSRLGRFDTPVTSILVTGGAMAAILLTFDAEGVAKLASTFKLLIFAMLNLCVVVMRESRLTSYVPGFRSPLYPWMQVAGFLIPFWLIAELGMVPLLFSVGIVVASVAWYYAYGRRRVDRKGAILHVFDRLGQDRYEGLEPELRQILKEKALGGSAPYEQAVAGSIVLDLEAPVTFERVARKAADGLSETLPCSASSLLEGFLGETRIGVTPVSHGAAIPHLRIAGASEPRMAMIRVRDGVKVPEQIDVEDDGPLLDAGDAPPGDAVDRRIYAFFFLVSPKSATRTHLHILAQIADHVGQRGFPEAWRSAGDELELKDVMLHEDRFVAVELRPEGPTTELSGRTLEEVDLGTGTLVVLVERDGRSLVPRADLELAEGDTLTVLGDADAIEEVRRRYHG